MSELAYDVNGEPIGLPASAQFWKVRRFRNPGMRGAPEIVIDRDGAPLVLPIDCSFVDFRELVDAQPGRYRLDPLDERRKVVANVPAAYVSLNEALRNSAPLGGTTDERDLVIRDLVRAHVEMVKTMSERFSSMMDAGANLLRAADAAGITSRKPPEPAQEPDDEEEDDDQEDEDDDQPSDLVQLLQQVMPMIQMYLATKMGGVDFPGAPSVPAAPTNAPPTPPTAPAPAAAPATAAVPTASAPVASAAPADAAAQPTRNADPTPTPAEMAHVTAVQAKLTPAERRIAMSVAMRMPADARAKWFAELCSRSIDDAVALIRSNLPPTAREPDAPTTATAIAAPPLTSAPTAEPAA